MRPQLDVSFAILAWNSREFLQRCLASIRNSLGGSSLSYEVLVLDNGSRDDTAELLAELAAEDPLHVIPSYQPSNLGTTRSRNMLFAVARGAFLCVMDSDVELAPGVLEALILELRADSTVGIVVPRITYPSGRWQKSFDRFPTLLDKVNRLFRLRRIEQLDAARYARATDAFDIDYAISAFWLMRRELLGTVGLLDERIFYAPEDVDFCLRVWRSGQTIRYVPSVGVTHHAQEISRGLRLNRAKFSHAKGLLYYFLKHRYLLRRPRFRAKA